MILCTKHFDLILVFFCFQNSWRTQMYLIGKAGKEDGQLSFRHRPGILLICAKTELLLSLHMSHSISLNGLISCSGPNPEARLL